MRKEASLLALTLSFTGFTGVVSAVDLNGAWEGYMYCSDDFGASGEYFYTEIVQSGDFFQATFIQPYDEECGGVLNRNRISMTCESGTIAHGKVRGNKIRVVNHIPADAVTCKGTATRIPD